jgi:hypothetical protein
MITLPNTSILLHTLNDMHGVREKKRKEGER